MKTILISSITFLFLLSCSVSDKDTFSLVCNVDSEVTGEVVGKKIYEKKKETVSLNFVSKKLDGYDCPVWTDKEIICGKDSKDETFYLSERINLDRQSGVIKYSKTNVDKFLSQNKNYVGQCEKVKQTKF